MQSLERCACSATAVRALVVHGACIARNMMPPPLLALLREARGAAARDPYNLIPDEIGARVRRALLGAPWRAVLAQYLASTPFASTHPSARIALSSFRFASRRDYDVTDDWHRDLCELRVLVPLSRVCARTGATRLLLRGAPISIDGLPRRRERDGFLWVVREDAPSYYDEILEAAGDVEHERLVKRQLFQETSPFESLRCDPSDVVTLDADEGDVVLFDASAVYHARGRPDAGAAFRHMLVVCYSIGDEADLSRQRHDARGRGVEPGKPGRRGGRGDPEGWSDRPPHGDCVGLKVVRTVDGLAQPRGRGGVL